MFGLGGWEWIIIVLVAVILFGSQAPKIVAKFFGNAKSIKEEISKGVDTMKDDKSESPKK
jgi:Sec-independent protein translocase protein TatA